MAPLFLLEGIDQGFVEFREPLLKGFRWILGKNELGLNMVDHSHSVIWRSIERHVALPRLARLAKAASTSLFGTTPSADNYRGLSINRECRSYELGWALWAFGGRTDFDEILNDSRFDRQQVI